MKHLVKISLLAIYLVAVLPAFAFAQAAGTQPARMLFDPSSGSVVANPNFTVNVKVDIGTGAQSAGADAVVKFDTIKLTFVSADKVTEGNPSTFYGNNGLFTATPASTANTSGTVEIGRTADAGSYASGVGVLAKLTFTPKVAVGQTVSLNFDFTLGSTVDSNVASNVGGVDLLGGVTNATLTIASASTTTPTITSISPTHGSKDLAQSVVITGTNFGTQGTNSKVYIGTKLATVSAWSDTQITIQIPSEPDLTQNSTRQIKVHREDALEATYTGYTYDVAAAPLPDNGPEVFSYLGLAMSAFGMAGLSYLKLFAPKQAVETKSEPNSLAE